MKRVIFLTVLGLLFTSTIVAQPTITYDNAPKIGDVYHEAYFSGQADPGPDGANQTWDFGNVLADTTAQMEIISPAGTPFESDFPEANMVSYIENSYGQVYGYGNLSPSEFQSWGTGVISDTGNVVLHYIDPEKQMEFPFSYQDSFTDDYFSIFQAMGLTIHRRGTTTITADAWGSITTPEATYSSVLRVKNVSNSVDSMFMGEIFIMAMTTSSVDYNWYTGDYGFPVFELTISSSNGVSDTAGAYKITVQSVGETASNLSNIRIYPNPARNTLYVSIPADNEADLYISLLDLTGKEVIRRDHDFSSQNNLVTLNLNNLTPGMYFLKVYDGHNSFTKKVIVE